MLHIMRDANLARCRTTQQALAYNRFPQATYTDLMLERLWVAGAGLVGLLLGSFLNVCISRLPAHRSIVSPGSHCPHCRADIRWYDNVPVLSFLLLKGRCRDCGARISWRYPAVELATAFWFCWVASGLARILATPSHGTSDALLQAAIVRSSYFVLGFLLIGLAAMDWETQRLPDAFTLSGIALGVMMACTQAIFLMPGQMDVKLTPRHDLRLASPGSFVAKGNVFLTGPEHLVFGRLAAVIAAALLIVLIRAIYRAVRGRDGLGLGDAKLLALIAAFLGFWPAMLAFYFGVILCAGWALMVLARGRGHALTRLPLGSFLALGGLLAAVCGERLLPWYRSLL
jgi:leader peptidase (prepilin peptidase)/N-methyltransferase